MSPLLRAHIPTVLFALALACVGCGASGGGAPAIGSLASKPQQASHTQTSLLTISFVVPSQALLRSLPQSRTVDSRRSPRYVSVSTKSLTVTVTPQGAAALPSDTVACTNVCTASIVTPVGAASVALQLFDATNGTGNVLSLKTATSIAVAPGIVNTFNLTANPVLDHAALALGAATVTGGTATSTPVTVSAYDADNNVIVGPGSFVDANGTPVTITLLPTVNHDIAGTGAITLSQSSLSSAATAPITATYNGQWLVSSTVSLGLPAAIAARSVASAAQSVAGQPAAREASFGLPSTSNNLYGLTLGADGNFWVLEFQNGLIAQVDPTGTLLNTYGTANGLLPGARPGISTLGPDRNVWFTDFGNAAVGKITTGGAITEYQAGICGPTEAITTGPDGKMWFADVGCGDIGSIPTSGGAASEYPIAGGGQAITTGSDGNIWYGDDLPEIGLMSTSGAILTTYSSGLLGTPDAMILGSDNNVWFTTYGNSSIGYITPGGAIHEFTAGLQPGSFPRYLVVGPDNNIWFTDQGNGLIGRCTLAGAITMFDNSYGVNPANGAFDITIGPDHNIWFTASDFGLGTFVY